MKHLLVLIAISIAGCGVRLQPEIPWTPSCGAQTRLYDRIEMGAKGSSVHVVGCETEHGQRVGLWRERGESFDELQEYVAGVRHGRYDSIYIARGEGRHLKGTFVDGQRDGLFVDGPVEGSQMVREAREGYITIQSTYVRGVVRQSEAHLGTSAKAVCCSRPTRGALGLSSYICSTSPFPLGSESLRVLSDACEISPIATAP